jgi:hypothetical protein
MATHLFISYVREDAAHVDRICETLKAANVDVWLDRERIAPGMRWQDSIRHAISQGAFFMACFSKQYWNRPKTVMNTELGIAIGELGERRNDQTWFIPVRLDDCRIPDLSIRPGETLMHLQYVDLFRDWHDGMRRIMMVLTPFASPEYGAEARRWVAQEFRTTRALQLYDEWHNPLLHESRIQVSNFIELVADGKIERVPTLSEFERAQREPNSLTAYADHFFRVVHFLERWALLRDDALLDHALASRLLGSYVRWYRERLVLSLLAGETNPDFVRLLDQIDEMASSDEIAGLPAHAPEAKTDA